MPSHSSVQPTLLISLAALAALALSSAAEAKKIPGVVYAFQGGGDGAGPAAPLIEDAEGNLYGTTAGGGTGTACGTGGCGTIFRIAPDGTESVVYSFQGGCDGAGPQAGLISDGAGNFYGTTAQGGICGGGNGTVFKLAADGTESVVYAFKDGKDGAGPLGSLVLDRKGNLYGATVAGGKSEYGTVFKIARNGKETVLHAFQGGDDGRAPEGGVVRDKQGNLYGTTIWGGNVSCQGGCGTVFKVAPDGAETILHSFQGSSDGSFPVGGLILDKAGNLYGTTENGGDFSGTVFKLAPDGTETVLYSFNGNPDGSAPAASLIMDKQGNLYGTTLSGGGGTGCKKSGCGSVFKITPDGQESILFAFDKKNGEQPIASVIRAKNGSLYGTASQGGKYKDGVVFQVKP